VSPIHIENASTVISVFGAARNSAIPAARAANSQASVHFIEVRCITQPAPMLPAMLNNPSTASDKPATLAGRPHSSITPGRCVTRKNTCRPQTKKVALISQKPRLASASRSVAPACGAACATAAADAGRRRKASASGSATSASPAMENAAVTQPASEIIACVAGASTSWPSGPPAPTMPTTSPRRSAETRWLTVPTSSEGLPTVAAMPLTASTATSSTALSAKGSSALARAASRLPATMTRAAPWRSASTPTRGCATPQVSWLTAIAKLMVATPRPVAELSGEMNSPNTVREPMVTASSSTAAATSTHAPVRAGL